ncbi:MAG: hypothetical protein QOE64_1303 [Frankiales bacterium]|jgi:hypothetical protein|nr:hypothetical protein [Frankiales bacterium]
MRRFTTSLVATVMLSTGLVGIARGGDGHDGFNGKAESATSTDNTFVATSTAFVDPDGTQHDVDSHHDRATSPYEYQVHRFAGICPKDALGQPQDLVFVDRRLVSAGPDAPWDVSTVFCASPNAQPVDLGNIAAQAATVTETLQPPRPLVRAQPGGTTLVGNPTVFSGADLADMTPPALVNPLSGRALQLTVRPTTWTWDFNDGSDPVTTPGPPPPYAGGGSTAGLLTHTYKHAADVTVTVTVSWAASYTISGVAAVQAVAQQVTSQATIPLQVRQARSQLVSH